MTTVLEQVLRALLVSVFTFDLKNIFGCLVVKREIS